ncbi:hypothetical protein QBZ16_003890 [Prototheca wickerhamii]|uniref:S-formylglutathione hydrolase n=1 Tax=Prototheca wickerhamii TaxID=3111 RepID=A0AAD9IKS3_PROWI|nr:hypothetical protein QBZ16_003890 [Prototheca wickerhamii]
MTFSVFHPPAADKNPVPVLYYLSGLTCTDDNVMQKSGVQRIAAELGVAVIAPDTSPRGLGIEGEDESWDFGTGAGFYLNATQEKWRQYRMYDYVVKELPMLLAEFSDLDLSKASITGHSMGGHGALTIALKNPEVFKSVSAFSPIVNPCAVPWGQKAFNGYLGDDKEAWKQYDATELVKAYSGPQLAVLIDQGTGDNFYPTQLQPEAFAESAKGKLDLELRMQEGYDHSYYFISTFIEDHVRFHAKFLK